MLYELLAVVRPGRVNETKDIARVAGSLILSQRGVIRSIDNWGTYLLTKPVRKHQAWHAEGHHFVMRFDASPDTQAAVRKMLGLDPRMLRFGITRLGDRNGTLASIADLRGAQWSRAASASSSSPGGAHDDLDGLLPPPPPPPGIARRSSPLEGLLPDVNGASRTGSGSNGNNSSRAER